MVILIDGFTEAVKYEIRKLEITFLCSVSVPLADSFVQSMISSLVKSISERGVRGAGRGCNKIL